MKAILQTMINDSADLNAVQESQTLGIDQATLCPPHASSAIADLKALYLFSAPAIRAR